jgi:hypothetical protein
VTSLPKKGISVLTTLLLVAVVLASFAGYIAPFLHLTLGFADGP